MPAVRGQRAADAAFCPRTVRFAKPVQIMHFSLY